MGLEVTLCLLEWNGHGLPAATLFLMNERIILLPWQSWKVTHRALPRTRPRAPRGREPIHRNEFEACEDGNPGGARCGAGEGYPCLIAGGGLPGAVRAGHAAPPLPSHRSPRPMHSPPTPSPRRRSAASVFLPRRYTATAVCPCAPRPRGARGVREATRRPGRGRCAPWAARVRVHQRPGSGETGAAWGARRFESPHVCRCEGGRWGGGGVTVSRSTREAGVRD